MSNKKNMLAQRKFPSNSMKVYSLFVMSTMDAKSGNILANYYDENRSSLFFLNAIGLIGIIILNLYYMLPPLNTRDYDLIFVALLGFIALQVTLITSRLYEIYQVNKVIERINKHFESPIIYNTDETFELQAINANEIFFENNIVVEKKDLLNDTQGGLKLEVGKRYHIEPVLHLDRSGKFYVVGLQILEEILDKTKITVEF